MRNGPPLFRPIPRRPFELNLKVPTPPEGDDDVLIEDEPNDTLNLEYMNSRLLDPINNGAAPESTSISRTESAVNMTSSTLRGIFSPEDFPRDKLYGGVEGTGTPWGTGAESPAHDLSVDSPHYELLKNRALPSRRRSSLHPAMRPQRLSTLQRVFYLGSRGLFLFGLGVLYGMLVDRLQEKQQPRKTFQVDGMIKGANQGYHWMYLAFWGTTAVVMGSLMPWFDGKWEQMWGHQDVAVETEGEHIMRGGDYAEKDSAFSTDWALAVRGIGVFVGIAFAIRKLSWDSTLQVSLTLALANPVLWYLLDRSRSGFLLSFAVGLIGSTILMGFKPDMVPTPANLAAPSLAEGSETYDNTTSNDLGGFPHQPQQQLMSLGRLSFGQETVATGIWTWSVLFCCCVCFGNIGRWLVLNRSMAVRGRWAQRR
ncbi:hypothetical protein M426DRAFT_200064 [Hypoxylon sp. CI-4A]|nr:hypothetical protein M426DRAFT_200064 [Hypoxylon sp. CI-4A]